MIFKKIQNGKIYYSKATKQTWQGKPLLHHLCAYYDIKPHHNSWFSFCDDEWLPIPSEDPINLIEGVISVIEGAEFDVDSSCERNSDHETCATVEGIREKDRERVFLEIFTLINTWLKTYGEESVIVPLITRKLCSLESNGNQIYYRTM